MYCSRTCSNLASPTTIFEGVLCVVFALDMLFSFRTAYYEGETVVSPKEWVGYVSTLQ